MEMSNIKASSVGSIFGEFWCEYERRFAGSFDAESVGDAAGVRGGPTEGLQGRRRSCVRDHCILSGSPIMQRQSEVVSSSWLASEGVSGEVLHHAFQRP